MAEMVIESLREYHLEGTLENEVNQMEDALMALDWDRLKELSENE